MADFGMTPQRIQKSQRHLACAADMIARRNEASREVATAVNTRALPSFALPDVNDWMLLHAGHHNTLPSMEQSVKTTLRFVRAQIACLRLRGEAIEGLLQKDSSDEWKERSQSTVSVIQLSRICSDTVL